MSPCRTKRQGLILDCINQQDIILKKDGLVLKELLYIIIGHHLLIKDVSTGFGAFHHSDNLGE